jgi:tRNA 2-selenouridine synthase
VPVATEKLHILPFLEQAKNQILIDVRSPAEYAHAHFPGAINIPIFTNEERKIVGTIYKQQSRELAIKEGLQIFGPKMRSIVEKVEEITNSKSQISNSLNQQSPNQTSTIHLYCWRGGMRSGAMAWLLQLYGFKVTLLAGGYKSFRRWAIEQQAYPHQLMIVGGYTGSGKTEVLKQLAAQGQNCIDLESLAGHKGSAFGNLEQTPQPSQEMFENTLAVALHKIYDSQKATNNSRPVIWIEDESQRIGKINIPQAFWQHMRQSPVFFLDIPFAERLKHLVEEYGTYPKDALAEGIQRIAKRLGGLETKNALHYLWQDNLTECFSTLLKYYDKQYLKGLHNRTTLSSLLTNISGTTVSSSNASLLLTPHSSV